jgi:hypothetical protein
VTGAYFWRTSGIGPGTGVADAGAMVCCADAVPTAAAANIAAAHTPCINFLVSNMAFPPWGHIVGPVALDAASVPSCSVSIHGSELYCGDIS